MTLGILTVTFNAAAFIRPFLKCCAAQCLDDFELLIIDNASNDASVDIVKRFPDKRFKVVANDVNIGYAAACNQGIKYFSDRGVSHVLFINNDTEFGEMLFGEMLKLLQTYNAEAVTPRIVYFDKPDRNWYAGGRFVFWKGFQGQHNGEGRLNICNDEKPRKTDVAPGCCVLVTSSVFNRIGCFDEKYFVYFEDTDFFLRMKRAGMTLLYIPTLVLQHKVSLSTGGAQSPFSIRYYQRNQIYLIRKHFQKGVLLLQLAVISAKILARLCIGKDSFRVTVLRFRAVREGLSIPLNTV